MRVLVACEFSGVVRDAFRARGHDAVSCDLLPSERPGPHIVGDVRNLFADGWDLLIAHPPCTSLANSGAKHLYLGCRRENGAAGDRWANLGHAAAFFLAMLAAPIPRIAVENPIMLGHVRRLFDIPVPSQTIQPWQFGHPETKATCLWLKGLPRLTPTHVVEGRDARVHREPPGPERWRNRSRTYPGIAAAMAEQWTCAEAADSPPKARGNRYTGRADHAGAHCDGAEQLGPARVLELGARPELGPIPGGPRRDLARGRRPAARGV